MFDNRWKLFFKIISSNFIHFQGLIRFVNEYRQLKQPISDRDRQIWKSAVFMKVRVRLLISRIEDCCNRKK